MNKQKLIFFTLDITISGGIERVVSNMVQHYTKQNKYNIEIISLFNINKEIPYYIPKEVKVSFLTNKSYNLTGVWIKFVSHIRLVTSLLQYSIPNNSILISTTTNISIYLSLMRFKYKAKLIAAEHGYYYAFGKATRIIRIFSYRFVDIVVTLTNSEKRIYEKFCKKVVVIPNSLSFFPSIGTNIQQKRVISVGRLVYEKGYEHLLPIYVDLARKYKDWEFLIFGAGYLEDALTKILINAPQNVKLLPPTKKIQQELLNSSIYVCSSTTEAFPMILLEAQACGLSVISFDCPPGPREIIHDQIDGVLVPPNDFKILYDELELMMNNSSRREVYSNRARENAAQFFPEIIFAQWDKILGNYSAPLV